MPAPKPPKLVAVVGPTASGKSALAVEIARRFGGEVVSADSRQVYRGLDLGSGKVTPEEMRGVPHHLLDVADPMTVYTGQDFARDAGTAVDGILTRGRLPVVAGGTFFYLELLLGTMQAAPVPPNLTLRTTLRERTDAELLTELTAKDPRRAATIEPENRHRLIRALEIVEALGAVPPPTPAAPRFDCLTLAIDLPLSELEARIKARLVARLEAGMLEEVAHLHEAGVSWERLEELGLEYRYLSRHLRGELPYCAMVDVIYTKSRQYAKRQWTWLRRMPDVVWVPPTFDDATATRIDSFLSDAAPTSCYKG